MTTREHLLTHAEDLARRRGYDGFSFADLAEGAGIRKASVHHHFPTKAALVTDLTMQYSKRSLAHLHAANAGNAGLRLQTTLNLYRDALEGGRSQCLCVAFSAVFDRLPEATRIAVSDYQTEVRAWLERVFADAAQDKTIRQPGDPQAEAAAAFALLEGAQLFARAAKDPTLFDLATAPLRDRIQTGDTQ